MEYKIFTFLDKILYKNTLFRKIISSLILILGIIIIIIPLPLSVPTGIFLIVISIVLKVSDIRKVRYLIKIKKSIIYLFKNIKNKNIRNKKVNDIKKLYLKSINKRLKLKK